MSDGSGREWRLYLDDMIVCVQKVLRYTAGIETGQFVDNEITYDATLRNLELPGEAANRIPESIRARHSSQSRQKTTLISRVSSQYSFMQNF